MIIKRPKVRAVVVQIASYCGAQYEKGTNHRISLYETDHNTVFKIVEKALMDHAKSKDNGKTTKVKVG